MIMQLKTIPNTTPAQEMLKDDQRIYSLYTPEQKEQFSQLHLFTVVSS
jgi:Spy/CpxP family protein refolding chaperone